MVAPSLSVVEVSPRDGLQNEATILSTAHKLALIDHALSAGCKRIEVTSFVHPKRVPQMADAEAVCAGLPDRGDVCFSGLVLNPRGYDRLRATQRLDEAGLVVPATDTFGERNQGLNVADALRMACRLIRHGAENHFRVQVTIAVAFGCPFEGEVPLERLIQIAKTLAEAAPVEIALADTIGVAVPVQVTEAFGALKSSLGPQMPLRAHFHDTRNTGIANAYAAWQAGVQTLDSSIGGIGGCPFAPNASGNIATEDLVYMLNRSDVSTGLKMDQLLRAAEWLEPILDKKIPSQLLKAGNFPTLDITAPQVS
ncbi:MAG: hydroxymethylglutaryl-CoA lyase [Gammaproteobacteria bacterium]|nr:hydroxymethylglutaryl-CoA lyase [Gammaproteobacteria bacterium]MCH1550168.1 hydroxymethylglutaryl-CoA lyase [Pseudomonadales bacterium]